MRTLTVCNFVTVDGRYADDAATLRDSETPVPAGRSFQGEVAT